VIRTTAHWFTRNFISLLIAFGLAVLVWVSAVVTADPNEQHLYRPVDLEIAGQASDLVIIGEVPAQVRLTLQAPRSIWNTLNNNPNLVHAWIDLAGLDAGEHTVKVRTRVSADPVRLTQVDPPEITLRLEALVSQTLPIQVDIQGDPQLGYRKAGPQFTPHDAMVSGPQSQVMRVTEIRARLNINGASETVKTSAALEPLDANGEVVTEVNLTPKVVALTQPINLLGGYKNVVVKVQSTGQVASGYRLTNISVTPPNVTVFSSNPQQVNEIPGYVETQPVNLTGLADDIDMRMALKLPEGVTLVGEQSVLVQVGVAAIEGSLTLALPVETAGLPPELEALISPASVDVILSGPLPVLEALTPASFRILVDLTGLTNGTYQLTPIVDLFPDKVEIQALLPETVEVLIQPVTPTATPAPTATSAQIHPHFRGRTPVWLPRRH
jgi:YbbR domain-containing protein